MINIEICNAHGVDEKTLCGRLSLIYFDHMSISHRSNLIYNFFSSGVSQSVRQYWHLYWACHCKHSFSQRIKLETHVSVKAAFFHKPINQSHLWCSYTPLHSITLKQHKIILSYKVSK